MTTPSAPHLRRRGEEPTYESQKARVLLFIACIWPVVLIILYIFTYHTPVEVETENGDSYVVNHTAGLNLRTIMDRVDVMGYGPTHPRVAVVVVGNDRQKVVSSVESVFSYTDPRRLFVVCAVMDGVGSDPALEKELQHIDSGTTSRSHGLRPDQNQDGDTKDDEKEPRSKKIHVLFSKDRKGIATSRSEAVDFISLLEKKHMQAGIKSPEEDLILLLLQSGATFTSRDWLQPITSALIVPPPIMKVDDPSVALKIANAVSFGIESMEETKAVAFDYTFQAILVEPSGKDLALSNGDSYSSPALAGAATAMRLDTYKSFPAQDLTVMDEWQANLDLSLNLWLCGDGIDVLKDVNVEIADELVVGKPLAPPDAARFAAAWLDPPHQEKVLERVLAIHSDFTKLEWEVYTSRSLSAPEFPSRMQKKCRSFSWYETEINQYMEPTQEDLDAEEARRAKEQEEFEKAEAERRKRLVEKRKQAEEERLALERAHEEKVKEREEQFNLDQGNQQDKEEHPAPKSGKAPTVPLRFENREIVKKAQRISIEYEDVSGGHKEHPHLGARDAGGNFGYVHDETFLKKSSPAFDFPMLKEACAKHDNHWKMLTKQVHVNMAEHDLKDKRNEKRAKIFCLVYTISPSHDRIPYILQTWGPKCDGFMVGSNETDPSIGAVDIPHEGPEEYNNIWQKVRSMWSYIYDNYYDKYDWFHIGGDDVYLIVENLRLYLESEEILVAQNGGEFLPEGEMKEQTPLFLGRRFAYMGNMEDIFNSGGSGYTLNKAALKTIITKGLPNYLPHAHTFSEDTMIARVLRKYGVMPYDTKDEAGGERYMPFMPGHHWNYRPPAKKANDWYALYSINVKYGQEHCAKESVAFHYVKDNAQKRLHAILYGMCPKESTLLQF